MRPIDLTRQEAEDLVDLLEANDAGRPDRSELAAEIRKRWGMVERDQQQPAARLAAALAMRAEREA